MNAGTFAMPEVTVKRTPNSSPAAIAARKSAKIVVGGEMRDFLQKKVVAAGGDAAQVDVLRFGGKRKIGGVTVAVVPAVHSDGVNSAFLDKPVAEHLKAIGSASCRERVCQYV